MGKFIAGLLTLWIMISMFGWFWSIVLGIIITIILFSLASGGVSGRSSGGSSHSYDDDGYCDESKASHNGRYYGSGDSYPTCKDGSPDMRYSENRDRD